MTEKYGKKVKKKMAKDMKDIFADKNGFILSNISNIKASEIDILRSEMRKAGSRYFVLKNRLAQIALKDAGVDGLDDVFNEKKITGLGVVEDDPVQITKIMVDFAKKNKGFELSKGYFEGQVLTKERVKELSALPGKEQLIVMVLSMLNGPITNFVGVLSSLLRSLLYAINAIKEKKEKSE
jgi:large subunit ribosomal protein L10